LIDAGIEIPSNKEVFPDEKSIRRKVDILGEEKDAVMDLIQGIDLKRTEAFMECFNAINGNFNKLYMNFFDGTAQLSLTDTEKPLESGLIIEAKHGEEKRLKNIDSMSGGEKSLTSLAFIFSIQMYEPAPFYFFDEVDAALDLVNSQKIGKLVKEMSRNSQFVAITHNDLIIKVADRIIGVAKKNHESSVIGLKVTDPELEATSA
jgi:chromosome segregation protein